MNGPKITNRLTPKTRQHEIDLLMVLLKTFDLDMRIVYVRGFKVGKHGPWIKCAQPYRIIAPMPEDTLLGRSLYMTALNKGKRKSKPTNVFKFTTFAELSEEVNRHCIQVNCVEQ
jgi:hypothetical protein